MKQGIQQGKKYITDILVRQFNDKKISAKEGADYLGITVNEFLDLVNQLITIYNLRNSTIVLAKALFNLH